MVQTELWYEKMMEVIDYEGNKGNSIKLFMNPKDYNFAIGFKAKNKKLLENHFKSVKFIAKGNLESELEIEVLS